MLSRNYFFKHFGSKPFSPSLSSVPHNTILATEIPEYLSVFESMESLKKEK